MIKKKLKEEKDNKNEPYTSLDYIKIKGDNINKPDLKKEPEQYIKIS